MRTSAAKVPTCRSNKNTASAGKEESFLSELKTVLSNKYYLLLLAIYLLFYTSSNLGTSINVYYFQYIIGNTEIMGVISMASMVMMIGLMFNPALVKKFGMYKVNLVSYIVTTVLSVPCRLTREISGSERVLGSKA